jgi:predicted nucleic acid binding AN1-type Zn finger protein
MAEVECSICGLELEPEDSYFIVTVKEYTQRQCVREVQMAHVCSTCGNDYTARDLVVEAV